MAKKVTNRIEVVLVEQNKSSKWLAKKPGKNESTVYRWCINNTSSSIDTFYDIAKFLNVYIKDLLSSTKTANP